MVKIHTVQVSKRSCSQGNLREEVCKFWKDEVGGSLVEYMVLVAVVGLGTFLAAKGVGAEAIGVFGSMTDALAQMMDIIQSTL